MRRQPAAEDRAFDRLIELRHAEFFHRPLLEPHRPEEFGQMLRMRDGAARGPQNLAPTRPIASAPRAPSRNAPVPGACHSIAAVVSRLA